MAHIHCFRRFDSGPRYPSPTMKIHIYQMRHVFVDDDHVGKYDAPTRSIRLRAEFGPHADKVKAHFMRAHGMAIKVLVGDEQLAAVKPLPEFPHEVLAQTNPYLGQMTPALIEHARKHWSREDFDRFYAGRGLKYAVAAEAKAEDPAAEEAAEPKKRERKAKTVNTPES